MTGTLRETRYDHFHLPSRMSNSHSESLSDSSPMLLAVSSWFDQFFLVKHKHAFAAIENMWLENVSLEIVHRICQFNVLNP